MGESGNKTKNPCEEKNFIKKSNKKYTQTTFNMTLFWPYICMALPPSVSGGCTQCC